MQDPKTIKLSNGDEAIVDAEDYEWANSLRWHKDVGGYAVRRIRDGKRRKTIRLHRLINKTPDGMFTDHINFDRLDNRKANLRTVTKRQNATHQRKRRGAVWSKHRGVYFNRSLGKWMARVHVESRVIASYHKTEQDAALAYNQMAAKHYGAFACPNVVALDLAPARA